MKRLLAVLVMVLGACDASPGDSGEAARTPSPDPLVEISSTECPALPDGDSGFGAFALWPDEGARDVVPSFDSVCATPISPYLFGALNEMAFWTAGDLDGAALGILHRGNEPIATFFSMRVALETQGLGGARGHLEATGAALTEQGGTTIAWGRGGDHFGISLLEGRDVANLYAEGRADAVEAVRLWLGDPGLDAPDEIPELGTIPAALRAGAPLAGFPQGYEAVRMDPLSFMGSDFADEVTIHGNRGIEALGAAIVVSHGGRVVGTLVAGSGAPELAEWDDDLPARPKIASAGFSAGGTAGFVVGYDQQEVDAFVEAWEKELGR